jgi:hypothetical protein
MVLCPEPVSSVRKPGWTAPLEESQRIDLEAIEARVGSIPVNGWRILQQIIDRQGHNPPWELVRFEIHARRWRPTRHLNPLAWAHWTR